MKGVSATALLRIWLWGTGSILLLAIVWLIAPVLFFVLLLTAGLGLLSAIVVMLARQLEAWKNRRAGPQ